MREKQLFNEFSEEYKFHLTRVGFRYILEIFGFIGMPIVNGILWLNNRETCLIGFPATLVGFTFFLVAILKDLEVLDQVAIWTYPDAKAVKADDFPPLANIELIIMLFLSAAIGAILSPAGIKKIKSLAEKAPDAKAACSAQIGLFFCPKKRPRGVAPSASAGARHSYQAIVNDNTGAGGNTVIDKNPHKFGKDIRDRGRKSVRFANTPSVRTFGGSG